MVERSEDNPLPLLVEVERLTSLPGRKLGFGSVNVPMMLSALVNEESKKNLREAWEQDVEWLEDVGAAALFGDRSEAIVRALNRSDLSDRLHELEVTTEEDIERLVDDLVEGQGEPIKRRLPGLVDEFTR